MKNLSKAMVFFAISACAACVVPSVEERAEVSDELTTLVPAQIEDIAEFMPNSSRSVAYSGRRRYVGIRIHADKGVKILTNIDIERFNVKPVAAITDEKLHVLAREVGGSISGAPGHSFSFAELVAPAAGTYWVLWGEDTRTPFTLKLSYSVKRSAGTHCHHDNMCVSESCVAELCMKTQTGTYVGGCIVDSDCTSNSCVSGLCMPILDGGSCSASSDCEHLTCESGRCTCLPGGATSDSPQRCCSHRTAGNTCTAD
jgi:hypothetical protein